MNTVAIVLFGMPRSIDPFLESIEHTLLSSIRRVGLKYQIVGKLNLPRRIENSRSGESGIIEQPLKITEIFPDVELMPQDESKVKDFLSKLSKFGDSWSDNFQSLSNLLHQQQSLITGTKLALDTSAEHFVFIRPDLIYHDDFDQLIKNITSEKTGKVIVPAWQFCGGLNDRFAFAIGRKAAESYGFRLRDADSFVARGNRPLHSERLLAYSLGTRGISVDYMGHRASRCRIDGKIRKEDFAVKIRVKWRTNLRLKLHPRSFA
jgi:hypothetical protein